MRRPPYISRVELSRRIFTAEADDWVFLNMTPTDTTLAPTALPDVLDVPDIRLLRLRAAQGLVPNLEASAREQVVEAAHSNRRPSFLTISEAYAIVKARARVNALAVGESIEAASVKERQFAQTWRQRLGDGRSYEVVTRRGRKQITRTK